LKNIILWVFVALGLNACVIQDEAKDGLWEIRTKVSTATLTVDGDRTGSLDFTFEYLLGLVDDDGVEQVDWEYSLIDLDGQPLGGDAEIMRQAQLDKTEVFVQGERPRKLIIDQPVLTLDNTYVLWIKVRYRDGILAESLISVSQGMPHVDASPTDDIPQFSTR
jgi:hypothetical protein